MTVYVDELQAVIAGSQSAGFGFKRYCHMTADSLPELHAMAEQIGLQPDWFQPHPLHPHYDLTSSKRGLAFQHGAKFLPASQQAKLRLQLWRTRISNI